MKTIVERLFIYLNYYIICPPSLLNTKQKVGQELQVFIEKGKHLILKLIR